MKYVKGMLVGCYIFIPVFLFLSLCGCKRGYHGRDNREYNGEYRYYYREGSWYRHDSLGHDIAVAALAIGALIDGLPPRHETVVVEGAPYYHDEKHYYRQSPKGGYVVVAAPVIVQSPSRGNYDSRGARGGNGRNKGNLGEGH